MSRAAVSHICNGYRAGLLQVPRPCGRPWMDKATPPPPDPGQQRRRKESAVPIIMPCHGSRLFAASWSLDRCSTSPAPPPSCTAGQCPSARLAVGVVERLTLSCFASTAEPARPSVSCAGPCYLVQCRRAVRRVSSVTLCRSGQLAPSLLLPLLTSSPASGHAAMIADGERFLQRTRLDGLCSGLSPHLLARRPGAIPPTPPCRYTSWSGRSGWESTAPSTRRRYLPLILTSTRPEKCGVARAHTSTVNEMPHTWPTAWEGPTIRRPGRGYVSGCLDLSLRGCSGYLVVVATQGLFNSVYRAVHVPQRGHCTQVASTIHLWNPPPSEQQPLDLGRSFLANSLVLAAGL